MTARSATPANDLRTRALQLGSTVGPIAWEALRSLAFISIATFLILVLLPAMLAR
jgi:hypothetical protein